MAEKKLRIEEKKLELSDKNLKLYFLFIVTTWGNKFPQFSDISLTALNSSLFC